jgi:glycosyltransferase involved in cell wall biosynthesis
LQAQGYPYNKYEIIVVDDGSRPSLRGVAGSFPLLDIKYLYQKNSGPSAARNRGIRHAAGGIIAFLDDDCIPQGSWLYNIVSAFKTHAGINVLQGVPVLPENGNPFVKTSKFISEFANEIRIANANDGKKFALFFGPGNACIKRKFLLDNNLFFDEALVSREDEDLYRRMEQIGVKIIYMPDIAVMHFCGCNLVSDFLRYFGYGRGECLLRRKWGDYTRQEYNITFDKITRRNTIFLGVLILAIWKFRQWASFLGFKYEEWRVAKQAPCGPGDAS